ncbi:MAG: hypothetical protein H6999_05120 [Hahellaceae bacterium]|nr:hypothetical protein [Hahellaceae bacterium]MCP5169118.1 hypothetical protein [Hahellaceae bacterium]
MFPVMTTASRKNGILFILLLAAMLIYSLPRLVSFASHEQQALALYQSGELSRKFEQRYDSQFFIRDAAIEAWATLQYLLFKEGAPGVVVGRDGWLFTNEEYLVPANYATVLQGHMAHVTRVQAQLQAQGKQLILLPVPMKLDIYAEHSERQIPERVSQVYDDFLQQLQSEGIAVAPIRSAFLAQAPSEKLYLSHDTHWTPAGAQLAATTFAAAFPELKGTTAYQSHPRGEKELAGDLTHFLKVHPQAAPEIFTPDVIPLFETLKTSNSLDDGALFGEAAESIALVGSSYTKIDDWNFAGFMKEALQQDLVVKAVEAKGPFQAMEDFLASPLLTNADIQTVVWEFPVRVLLTQDSTVPGWQKQLDDLF